MITITKPGKENRDGVSKFRPISLLIVGGKILGKVLINRINYHLFTRLYEYLHVRIYASKRQINAAMEVKEFVK